MSVNGVRAIDPPYFNPPAHVISGLTPLLPFCGTFNLNNVAELAIWRTRKSFRGRGSALESAGAVYSAPYTP